MFTGMLDDETEDFLLHLEAEGRSPRTIQSYRRVLRRIAGITGKDPSRLTGPDVDRVRAEMRREGYSDATRHLVSSVLRGYLRYAGKADVADAIRPEPLSWLPKEAPTMEQMEQVISCAKTWEEKALALTLYSTGLRLRELLGDEAKGTQPVMLKDIDWDRKRIRLRGGKGSGPTGEEAYAYFMLQDEETLRAIRKYASWRKDIGPIFMISPRKAQALVKRAGRRCGVHLTPHLLRHACATHLLQLRVGIAHVQTQLRHKSIETTRRYTRITGEDMEQVRARLKEAGAHA